MINQKTEKTLLFSALALFLCAAPARAEEDMMDMMMDMPDVTAYGTITIGSYVTRQDELLTNLGANGVVGGTGADADTESAYDDLTFKSDGEIGLKASETLYNGMELNAHVLFDLDLELEEYALSLDTGIGTVRIGSVDTAAEALHVTLPVFSPGNGATGLDSPDLYPLARLSARNSTFLELDSDANQIAYFTPRSLGLVLGVSYTPQEGDTGQTGQGSLAEDGTSNEDIISFAANYEGSLLGFGFSGSAGYLTSETDSADDMTVYSLGAQISRGNLTLGGAWLEGDNMAFDFNTDASIFTEDALIFDQEDSVWTVGLAYERGSWTYGVAYRVSEKDFSIDPDNNSATDNSVAHTAENNAIQLGVIYDMGDGLSVGLDLQRIDDSDPSQATGEADSYFGGFIVSLSF